MERVLNNKVVVVTGGAEGIGFAITEVFLQHGANVIILDVNETRGTETVKVFKAKYGETRAEFIKCDVTKDLATVSEAIFEKYKRVDVLVNNAGIADENDLKKTLEINTVAVIEWTMKFREHMRKDKDGLGGTIINIASIYGFMVDPYLVYYKASKFAVMGFTKALGHKQNYEKTGVRIVAVCPGFTYTSLTSKSLAWDEHREEFVKHVKTLPWLTADAVGRAALDVFKTAESGTAWMINGKETMEQV